MTQPVAVTIVDHSGDEERIRGQAVFDNREIALDAVCVLLRMFAFDGDRRIEVSHA
jgi:hypothetical protein